MSLSQVLFDECTQRQFILDVLPFIKRISLERGITSHTLLHGDKKTFCTDDDETFEQKKPGQKSMSSSDLLRQLPANKPHAFEGFRAGSTFMEWVAENGSPMMLTWSILILLFVSDHCKKMVCECTPEPLSMAYFATFDNRFEEYLCGRMVHNKSAKKSEVVVTAKSPTEIVLREWLEVKRVYTTPSLYA